MTNLQVAQKLNGKRFYSNTFGDIISIKDLVIYCDDKRTEILNDKHTLKALVKESGLIIS